MSCQCGCMRLGKVQGRYGTYDLMQHERLAVELYRQPFCSIDNLGIGDLRGARRKAESA